MSAETDLQAVLDAHAPLTALVGNRIAMAAVVPAETVQAAVVYLARHERVHGIGAVVLADAVTFTLQCWADTAVAAAAVADAAEAALATAPAARSCTVTTREPVYDEETGLDGVVLTVEWWA